MAWIQNDFYFGLFMVGSGVFQIVLGVLFMCKSTPSAQDLADVTRSEQTTIIAGQYGPLRIVPADVPSADTILDQLDTTKP